MSVLLEKKERSRPVSSTWFAKQLDNKPSTWIEQDPSSLAVLVLSPTKPYSKPSSNSTIVLNPRCLTPYRFKHTISCQTTHPFIARFNLALSALHPHCYLSLHICSGNGRTLDYQSLVTVERTFGIQDFHMCMCVHQVLDMHPPEAWIE